MNRQSNIGISGVLERLNSLTMMVHEISSTQNEDGIKLGKFIQAEHGKMLQRASKLFDSVPVCLTCMRIYRFLSDVYTRIEEDVEKDEKSQKRHGTTIFLGLDPKINDKVLQIVKRQLERNQKEKRTQ